MVRGVAQRWGLASAVLTLWLISMPLPAAAQQKCCECGTTFQDSDTTKVCFTDPSNANECEAACDACTFASERTEFNANEACDVDEHAARCAGHTFANPGDGGANCPAAPAECNEDSDCDDSNACTTDSCEGEPDGTCQNAPITCPTSSNPCLIETCSEIGGCGFVDNDGVTCNDFDVCTENDTCSGGECTGDFIEGCVPPVAPAPAASNWGLGILAISLVFLAVVILRRRGARA